MLAVHLGPQGRGGRGVDFSWRHRFSWLGKNQRAVYWCLCDIFLWPSLSVITQRQSKVPESDSVAGKNQNKDEHGLCVLWLTLDFFLVKLPSSAARLQSSTYSHDSSEERLEQWAVKCCVCCRGRDQQHVTLVVITAYHQVTWSEG